jgi:sugar/nucleoside kinase (ribokinase family)
VFLPNNDEGEILTRETDPLRQAAALREKGVGTVVITLGGDGLLAVDDSGRWRAAHFPSDVIDQTGAGDAFCAGFISGMVRGLDLSGCLHYGSALGASCVRSIGCYEGVFDCKQAEAFLQTHRLALERV